VNSNSGIRKTAITAAFLAAFGASGLAFAIYEIEPNGSIATAQRLEIGHGGSAEVTAMLGNSTGLIVADVDFYVFEGREGDLVTLDIDGGMKLPGSGARSVDTVLAIFGPGGWSQNDDASVDSGSTHRFDARIDNFRLPATGTYLVGVSSYPRYFREDGTLTSNSLNSTSNGTYTLLISGVTPPLLQINVDVKPGNTDEAAPINPKSKGNIPVALLSSSDFNAPEVDEQSLRFGAQGDEASLLRCNKGDTDVNADGKRDLVCHFDTQTAGFEPGDLEGIVKGSLKDGRRFEGRGLLKVVPVKRQQ
jgi:Bacterial pre-peptidase C-terminal domain